MEVPTILPAPAHPIAPGPVVAGGPALIPGRVTLLVGCASDEMGATVTVAARQERRG